MINDKQPACIDYCNVTADDHQTVMNAATQVVSDTCKYDRGLKTMIHDELHWLSVHERIEHKFDVMVYRCLHDREPWYLADHVIHGPLVVLDGHASSQPLMLLLAVFVYDPLT